MGVFDLTGKRALVVGIANDHSIAWGAARALRGQGAEIAVTYLNEKAEPHVRPLANIVDASIVMPLDVTDEAEVDALFQAIHERWGGLDVLVHSVAFAPKADLRGRVVDTSAAGFALAMDVSVHSFVRLARRCEPLMTNGGACMTMSFYGAEKVVGSYHVMGPVKAALEAATRELASELGPKNISVNALSPGPMPTRAASGLAEFDELMDAARARSPLHRLATLEEVGATAAFLASDAARAITGSTIHVDCGYHVIG